MKKLSKDNPLNKADLDGDGIVTKEELDTHERFIAYRKYLGYS